MKEQSVIRGSILMFWTFFWGLSVFDKIIPDVHFLWVGKDFFALFVKFFGSLGVKDSLVATLALAGVSSLEAVNFTLYLVAFYNFIKKGEGSFREMVFPSDPFVHHFVRAFLHCRPSVWGSVSVAGTRLVLACFGGFVVGLQTRGFRSRRTDCLEEVDAFNGCVAGRCRAYTRSIGIHFTVFIENRSSD